MGVSPHLLYQDAHEGRARLVGGCPSLCFGRDIASPLSSPPSLHAVRWGRTLLGGSPWGVCGVWGSPPPLHAVRWERMLLYSGVPPFLWDRPARHRHVRSGPLLSARGLRPLLLFLMSRGVPLLLLGHAMRWACTLTYRGVPPFVQARPTRRGPARSIPCPLMPARGLRLLLGRRGGIPLPGPCCLGGSRGGVIGGSPPCPSCALLGGGSPPPPPPRRPLVLGAGGRSGGALGSVRPPFGFRALRARWEPPSGSCSPPHGVILRCCALGFPPDPSLHDMGTRCWLGIPFPLPPLGGCSH